MHGSNINRCLHFFLLLPSPEFAGETELLARKLLHALLIINTSQCVTINFTFSHNLSLPYNFCMNYHKTQFLAHPDFATE